LAGRRVLLVEDREDERQLYGAVLTRAGAEVDVVTDAGAALDASRRGYDAIVLDLVMPGLRGTETAVLLRSRGFDGALVGHSAMLTPEVVELWRAAGCDDVIPKGERFVDSLVEVIAEACARRGGGGVGW
jgi:two-component system response regulator MtrA